MVMAIVSVSGGYLLAAAQTNMCNCQLEQHVHLRQSATDCGDRGKYLEEGRWYLGGKTIKWKRVFSCNCCSLLFIAMYLRETCFENGMPAQLELYLISLPVQRKIYVCICIYIYIFHINCLHWDAPNSLTGARSPLFFISVLSFTFPLANKINSNETSSAAPKCINILCPPGSKLSACYCYHSTKLLNKIICWHWRFSCLCYWKPFISA